MQQTYWIGSDINDQFLINLVRAVDITEKTGKPLGENIFHEAPPSEPCIEWTLKEDGKLQYYQAQGLRMKAYYKITNPKIFAKKILKGIRTGDMLPSDIKKGYELKFGDYK